MALPPWQLSAGTHIVPLDSAGAAEELRQVIGFKREPAETRFRDTYLTKLRQTLGEPTLLVAYEQGRQLKLDEAIALALTSDEPETPTKAISAGN